MGYDHDYYWSLYPLSLILQWSEKGLTILISEMGENKAERVSSNHLQARDQWFISRAAGESGHRRLLGNTIG